MFRILIITLTLTACSKTIIPETPVQLKVITYAQIASLASDVYVACQERVLTKETCTTLWNNIRTAKSIVDSGVGVETASDILNKVRSKL